MHRVLVMSSERSGSNLLRSMLDAHSALHGPPPAHFTNALRGHEHLYGDPTDEAVLRRMADDVCRLPRIAAQPWEHQPAVDEVLATVEHRSLWGLVDRVFCLAAEDAGKSGWVSKDNHLYLHALAMARAMPGLKVVYLARDGRDVACSVLAAPYGPKHIDPIAREWRSEQRAALKVHSTLVADGASLLVRYEDLVTDTEAQLHRICDFLGLPFEEGMLAFHQKGAARKTADLSPYWSNLTKPVMSDNTSKYLRKLSTSDIDRFEVVAGPELAALGYPIHGPPGLRPQPGNLRRILYRWISRRREARARQGVDEKLDREGRQKALREMRERVVDAVFRG